MPQIAIVYNSQGGNGILGQGWSLSGLSAITRAGKDFYHDGKAAPATYTNDDAFVLDGQRLVPTMGSNGGDGTTYATEAESYSVTTSIGTIGSDPHRFVVQAKDGSIMEYGFSDDARVTSDDGSRIMVWRLNKIQDINGNYIWFYYSNEGRESRLVKIAYTGNVAAGISPYNEINFQYEERYDKNITYSAGNTINSKYLLWQIQVLGEGEVFKTWQFEYGRNLPSTSYLKRIEEFASDGSKLNDTRFKYGDQTDDYTVAKSNIDVASGSGGTNMFSGDFDGDGKSEILLARYSSDSKYYSDFSVYKKDASGSENYTALSGASEYWTDGERYLCVMNNEYGSKNFITADFDGDGKDDLLFMKANSSQIENFSVYKSRLLPSGFEFDKKEIIPPTLSPKPGTESAGFHWMSKNSVLLGDFDGDGRSDFIYYSYHKHYNRSEGTLEFTFNSFLSFPGKDEFNHQMMEITAPNEPEHYLSQKVGGYNAFVIDFNGDGKHEIMFLEGGKHYIYGIKKLITGEYVYEYMSEGTFPNEDNYLVEGLGDFNGDGKTDLFTKSKSGSLWYIAYATGTQFDQGLFLFNTAATYQDPCSWSYGYASVSGKPDRLFVADFNGDGKSDLLHERRFCNHSDYLTKTDINVYYFNGIGSTLLTDYRHFTYSSRLAEGLQPIISDVNGDGRMEFSFRKFYGSDLNYMHTLYLNKNSRAHLLEKVNDGYNRTTTFTYEPLTKGTGTGDGAFYVKGSGETYPVNNVQYPLYVATSMKQPDGTGGDDLTWYGYENLRMHRAGRGLLGFEKVKSYNVTTSMHSQAAYELNRDFYVSYLKTTKTFPESDYSKYTLATTNHDFTRIGSGYRFKQTNPSGTTEDLLSGRSSSYTNTYDADGNITRSESTLSGGVTITTLTESEYIAVGGAARPNAPSYITVTTTRNGKASAMDKTRLEYDTRGRLIESTTNPNGLITAYSLFKSWEYDVYGNKTKDRAFSIGLHCPETKYEYDSKGRFVTKSSSNSGDFAEYTVHKFWGKPLSVTGITGLVSTSTYDAWGRLVSETVPVSSTAHYTVTYSDAWDIGAGHLYHTLVQHPAAPDIKTWYDAMGRPLKTQQEHSGGAWTTATTAYTARGSVAQKTNEYLPAETPLTTAYTYDEWNRLKTETSVAGTTSYQYDFSAGVALTTITLPDGKVKKTKTDASGKLVESDNGMVGAVQFDYDSRGNELYARMKIFGSGNNFLTKEYDNWGRLVKLYDADAGATSYKYNWGGQLIEQKDANGKTTYFRYNTDLGQLVEKKLDGCTTTYSYYGPEKGYLLQREQVVSTRYGTVTDEYDYNEAGQLTYHAKNTNGLLSQKTFTYDAFGRPSVTEYSSGLGTRQHYDSYGFLKKITTNFVGGGPGDRVLYQVAERRGDGRVQRFTRANGLPTDYTYENGLLARMQDLSGIYDVGVGYDIANGNPYARGDFHAQVQETFAYDAADRLISSQAEKMDGSLTWPAVTITYDDPSPYWAGSYGRIMSKSDAGEYSYYGAPHNGVASISDPAGLVSHETQDIVYTPFHKTESIKEKIGGIDYEEKFVYDAGEDRAYSQQTQGGTLTHRRWYMGDYELDECAGSAQQHIHYISGDTGLVAIVIKEGTVFTYYAAYTDHLGSIVLLTDEIGTPVYRQAYGPWGRERDPATWGDGTGTGTKPRWLTRGYTGHEMLPEYGLINMNGRMYDPLNGRMLRPDNYVQDRTNTQNYNRFSYCLNNPLKYTDPTGDQYNTGNYNYGYTSYGASGNYYGVPYSLSYSASFSTYNTSYLNTYTNGLFNETYSTNIWGFNSSQAFSASYGNMSASWSMNFSSKIETTALVEAKVNSDALKGFRLNFENIGATNRINNFAKSSLAFIAADVAIPEPTDAAWPKWVGYGIIGGTAAYTLNPQQYSTTSIFTGLVIESIDLIAKMSFPKPWTYTYRPPSQDPVNNPPQGFDPNNLPNNIPPKWFFFGVGTYMIYDEYKSHIQNMQPVLPYTPPYLNPAFKPRK